jgi:SHS2 domain-containing protein
LSYQFVPHTADVKVEIEALTLEGLLADCVAVVRELVAGDSAVEERIHARFRVATGDPHEVVREFVRFLLDLFNVNAFIPVRLELQSQGAAGFAAVVHGETADLARHPQQPEVKALTRHDFQVRRVDSGWRATLVFDV